MKVVLVQLKRNKHLELRALDATPSGGVDLSGCWTAFCQQEQGEVISYVRLEQHGTAVFGSMQCKFAAAHPLEIRGILLGDRLVANYWRPHESLMGSGLLDLRLADGRRELHGRGSWYNAETGAQEMMTFRLQKNAT